MSFFVMIKMEADRYQQNHFAYIMGLLCLLSSIGLFAASLYLLPYLFFGWQYTVPGFVIDFTALLQEKYNMSKNGIAWVFCFALDFPAAILFFVADILSNRIDRKIYGLPRNKNNDEALAFREEAGSGKLVIKIILLIVVIFIVAQIFQWAISTGR